MLRFCYVQVSNASAVRRWPLLKLNFLKLNIFFDFPATSHHSSFGGGLFDFDPEDYYQPPPTRPPRPARPTQPPFVKPPRPGHQDEDRFDRPGHSTVIYRPKPTNYPYRPPATNRPYNPPSNSHHGSHHNYHPQLAQDPPNKVDFYPGYHPEQNEVDGSLNTASKQCLDTT